jgi:hypothetical protein
MKIGDSLLTLGIPFTCKEPQVTAPFKGMLMGMETEPG